MPRRWIRNRPVPTKNRERKCPQGTRWVYNCTVSARMASAVGGARRWLNSIPAVKLFSRRKTKIGYPRPKSRGLRQLLAKQASRQPERRRQGFVSGVGRSGSRGFSEMFFCRAAVFSWCTEAGRGWEGIWFDLASNHPDYLLSQG